MTSPVRRRLWSAVAGIAVVALGFTLASGLRPDGAASQRNPGEPATMVRDDPAPALTGRTLDGGAVDLSRLRGHVVLVNVMASWCAPCREELPLLAETARRWSADGLRFLGVAMRDKEGPLREMLAQTGASDLPVILDPTGRQAIRWGAAGVPETFVVDRAGRIQLHLAFALLRADRPAKAAAVAEDVLADRPKEPEAVLLLGLAQRAEHSSAATATLRRFLRLAPDHRADWTGQGTGGLRSGQCVTTVLQPSISSGRRGPGPT